MKTIVTAGEKFADIDVLACAIAYAELLNLEGKPSEAVIPGSLNSSITKTIKSWDLKYVTAPSDPNYEVVLVDISELSHIAKFVKLENIIEVYDHHFGFEEFWKERISENAHIEPVGACATQIWEEYKKRGLAASISPVSANLLATAILSNTLNFGASITHERDRAAFTELLQHITMPEGWQKVYFNEVSENIFTDIEVAIKNDTKTPKIPTIDFPLAIGQVELWDGSKFITENRNVIASVLGKFGTDWFMTVPSLSEKKNYLYSESERVQGLLFRALGISFQDNIGITSKITLRKEIIKKLLDLK
ncbi:MAG: hypothetical protein EXS48_02805 [Candidatus Staskawiczbacteria bacterium]|nr:hypothetical protein [Candidatus Staskawiczbacteria bacterium]